MKIEIRLAKLEDAREICKVHAYSWYTTYKELLPLAMLEERIMTYEKRIPVMAERCESNNLYVLTLDGQIVGMMELGKSRNNTYSFSGEIYAIYLLKEYQGKGYGKQLFLTGIKELVNRGYKDMILNVLDGNKTITFYEKYGGMIVGYREDQLQDIILKEKIMYFRNIKELVDKKF